jgi:hypothetical protein
MQLFKPLQEVAMDTVGISTTQKALDTLKSVPTWLLLGLCISILSVWVSPPFLASLSEPVRSAVPMALVAAGILTGCKAGSSVVGYLVERHRRSVAIDRERLLSLYRPLAALFLTLHITTCTGTASNFLQQRLQNARAELGAYRRRSVGLKRAWRALFDRQISSSTEIEYGGDFPISEIIKLVRKKAAHADAELFDLVNQADRSRYEEPDRAFLTDEEFSLLRHIDGKHRHLSARVGRAA